MLTGGDDGTYRLVLTGSHKHVSEVDVLDHEYNVIEAGVPVSDGAVRATLQSQTTREGSFACAPSFMPLLTGGVMSPYGNLARIRRGVEYGDGTRVMFDVMTGRIQSASLKSRGLCNVRVVDVAGELQDSLFVVPTPSKAGSALVDEFQRLVAAGYPQARFGASDVLLQQVAAVTWEADRAQALDDLAETGGAFWYTLPDGSFVLRLIPWTVTPPAGAFRPVFADGPGGLISEAAVTIARDEVFNAVSVSAERADGDAPLTWTEYDNAPASPTYWSGPFGRKMLPRQLQTPATNAQARSVALSTLTRAKALTDSWSWTGVCDPSLELGDVVTVRALARESVQVVASIAMPLGAKGSMQVTTRALVPVERTVFA